MTPTHSRSRQCSLQCSRSRRGETIATGPQPQPHVLLLAQARPWILFVTTVGHAPSAHVVLQWAGWTMGRLLGPLQIFLWATRASPSYPAQRFDSFPSHPKDHSPKFRPFAHFQTRLNTAVLSFLHAAPFLPSLSLRSKAPPPSRQELSQPCRSTCSPLPPPPNSPPACEPLLSATARASSRRRTARYSLCTVPVALFLPPLCFLGFTLR